MMVPVAPLQPDAAIPCLLEIRNLRVEVPRPKGALRIVDDVSLSLHRGEVMGLIGESGAGKSTIGLAVLGVARGGAAITGGVIALDGKNILTAGQAYLRDMRGRRVAYVAQSAAAAFNPAHRLMDQVIEASVLKGLMTKPEARSRAIQLFAELELPNPESFGERYPHQASGGQLQRAMTAMAMCARPDIIIFDEPTTALDVTTQIEVMRAIRKAIRLEGMAGLYISHDLAVVTQMADRVTVLRHGRMVESGPADQVLSRPAEAYTRQLIEARNLAHEPRQDSRALLCLSGVAASYGKVPICEQIDLSVSEGRTLAIIGESGSGKSTLGKVICGLLPPSAGSVTFAGEPLPSTMRGRTPEQLRQIQLVQQNPDTAMNPRQDISTIVGRPLTFFHGLRGAELDSAIAELLKQVELDPNLAQRRPGELSGGQKQRVCIARALAARPRIIVCDEVTSALDPLIADEVLKLLGRLQAEQGIAYVFITHDFNAVRAMADRIAVMHRGRIVRQGFADAVLRPPYDDYTRSLIEAVPELRAGWLDEVLSSRAT
jgi:peptide/nickel transport system ATP-binding protein